MAQTENRRVNIYINTEEAQKAQQKLLEKSEKLKAQIKELTEGTEEYQKRLKKFQDAENSLKALEQEASKLTYEMEGLNKESAEYIAKAKRLDEVHISINKTAQSVQRFKIDTAELAAKQAELAKTNQAYADLQDKIDGKVAPSIREMRTAVGNLRRELEGLPVNTQEFIDKTKQLQEAEAKLRSIEASVKDTRTAWQKLKGDLKEFGTFAAGTVAGEVIVGTWQAMTGFIGDALEKQKELSYKIFDMQKFLGLSSKDAEKLNSELSKIKSVTPTSELRDMAIAAGKLGVPTEQVKGFVKEMDIAQQALAGEFSSSAEETSVKLGKLKGQFEELNTQSWEAALPKISSTLLEAGASGAASAENLTDFGLRMGALGKLGPSFVQNMAIGAVLEEAGVSAEIASGGLSALFIQSGKESEKFAKQMGMSEEALKKLINTSPYDFLKELAKSFQGLDNDQVIAGLNRLGVGSNEAVKVLSILRDKLDDVGEKNKTFGETFEKGTKGQELAAERMKTFGAQVDMAAKEINAFVAGIQQGFVPVLASALSVILFVINAIKELPKFLKENQQWFAALGVALITFNGQAILANANAIRLAATEKTVAIATRAWSAAQLALNAVLKANPIGLVVTAVALLVAGIITAYQKSETFRGVLNGLWNVMKVVAQVAKDLFEGLISFNPAKIISAFTDIGGKIGKAYSDGFNKERDKFLKDSFEGNEQKIKEQQAKKYMEWKKQQGEKLAQAEREQQEKINKARAEELAKSDDKDTQSRKEALKKRLEEEKEAQRHIEALKIKAMEEGLAKRLAQMDFDAKEEIAKLKGNAAQIAEQKALIQAMLDKEKQKLIMTTVMTQLVSPQDQEEINFANEQKNIEARYKYRTEVEKQAYFKKQLEISSLENITIEERQALLQLNEEEHRALQLDAERMQLLSRMELLRQFGLEYSTEYQNLETQLLQNQIASNELKLIEEKKVVDAKISMWTSFSAAFGQIQSGINQMGAEGTAFSKALAVAQIAIDTAISISKSIAGATAAAAAGGPAAPFLLAGYIASMVGAVVSGIAGAKKALGEANVPPAPNTSGSTQQNVGGYYQGGFTTAANSDSQPVGIVHANEYVIPANLLRSNPIVANFARITEAFRTGQTVRGFQEGGSARTTSNQQSTVGTQQIHVSSPELLAEMRAMRQDIVNLRSIIFRGYVVYKDIKEMQDLENQLDEEITL